MGDEKEKKKRGKQKGVLGWAGRSISMNGPGLVFGWAWAGVQKCGLAWASGKKLAAPWA